MTTLPLGQAAYARRTGNMPEVKCINRFVERDPTNQVEHIALLARPGTTLLNYFPADTQTGKVRGCYSQKGIFGSDLFVVSGKNLWRYDGEDRTQIGGIVNEGGNPQVAFVKGAGYERLFIVDGLLLQYYDGGTHATGTVTRSANASAVGVLTYDGTGVITGGVVEIGGTYYGWNANVDANLPDGTETHPWLCLPGANTAAALANMEAMLNFSGTPGTDFSTALAAANPDVTAESTATTLTVTAKTAGNVGNAVTTTVSYADNLDWGATLEGGHAGIAASQTMTEHAGVGTLVNTTVEIGGVYYTWTTGSVDTGTPAGTVGAPWLIDVGIGAGSIAECIANFEDAINGTGTPGTTYSTALTAHPDVTAQATATTLTVTAKIVGTSGNAITTTMDSQTCSWGATLSHGDQPLNYLLQIGGAWYGWTTGDVDANSPNGSKTQPFLCDPKADPLAEMANMLNFIGTRGTDFSSALTSANLAVTASATATVLTLTSRATDATGNDVTLAIDGPSDLLTPSGATLAGGGLQALHGIEMPNGESVTSIASLNGFVFVACKDSQRFYLVRPGEITIAALDFFSKESSPDPIVDMERVGDVMVIMGSASTEFWSATGQNDTPFAPVQGRTASRGIIAGTAAPVDESTIIMVGNDYRVYAVGAAPKVISDHGIEERIRRQIRREKGLAA